MVSNMITKRTSEFKAKVALAAIRGDQTITELASLYFVERLWRSLKYEEVYLKDYETVQGAKEGIKTYFDYYNNERPHQSLDYKTPADVYFTGLLEMADLSKNKDV